MFASLSHSLAVTINPHRNHGNHGKSAQTSLFKNSWEYCHCALIVVTPGFRSVDDCFSRTQKLKLHTKILLAHGGYCIALACGTILPQARELKA